MKRILGIAVCALALLLLLRWMGAFSGRRGTIPERAVETPGARSVGPVTAPSAAAPERVAVPATTAVVEEPDVASPEAAGVALKIRIVEHRTRRALADLALDLKQGAIETTVRADVEGTAVTDAVWSAGPVSVRHRPDARDPRYGSRWELEPGEIRIAANGPHAVDATLTARRPELALAVRTVGPGGESLSGAEVELVLGWRGSGGRFLSDSAMEERTDAEGIARFPVFVEDSTTTSLLLQARHRAAGLASPVVPRRGEEGEPSALRDLEDVGCEEPSTRGRNPSWTA